jgi:hypothetical protein
MHIVHVIVLKGRSRVYEGLDFKKELVEEKKMPKIYLVP